jgi:hypothetical protein
VAGRRRDRHRGGRPAAVHRHPVDGRRQRDAPPGPRARTPPVRAIGLLGPRSHGAAAGRPGGTPGGPRHPGSGANRRWMSGRIHPTT